MDSRKDTDVRYEPGTLVAVTGDGDAILMIGRVIADNGSAGVVVRSDDQLEREAAHEYGFEQPPARTMTVQHDSLRSILPRLN